MSLPQPPWRRCAALLPALFVLACASLTTGCSVNPATGRQQLALVSEQQEIAMGQEAHQQILAQFGRHPDEELQRWFQAMGDEMAAVSERPNLPWTFTVLDDPLVNAFALPGGYIYITRGILSHLSSEAELAGVLGHEIGHVTARHGVSQMSKAMLGQMALGVGMIAAPEYAGAIGDLGGAGLGLLFLKFGRDDERQSDLLGLRYARGVGFDPREIPGVYDMLGRVSAAAGASPIPNWLATHPAPEDRTQRLDAAIGELAPPLDGRVARDAYLDRLDGLVYGSDPRQGFFRDGTFYHPDLAFSFELPPDWKGENTRQAVLATTSAQDAVLVLTLAEEPDRDQAARRFFSRQGIVPGESRDEAVNGLPARRQYFSVPRQGTEDILGVVGFVELGGRVYQLLAYTLESRASRYEPQFYDSLRSFERVTDRDILDTQPRHLEIVRVSQSAPLADQPELRGRDITEHELVNNLDPREVVEAGTRIKRIVGEKPD